MGLLRWASLVGSIERNLFSAEHYLNQSGGLTRNPTGPRSERGPDILGGNRWRLSLWVRVHSHSEWHPVSATVISGPRDTHPENVTVGEFFPFWLHISA